MNCEIVSFKGLHEFIFWVSPTPGTAKVVRRVQLKEETLGGLSAKDYLAQNRDYLLSLPHVEQKKALGGSYGI